MAILKTAILWWRKLFPTLAPIAFSAMLVFSAYQYTENNNLSYSLQQAELRVDNLKDDKTTLERSINILLANQELQLESINEYKNRQREIDNKVAHSLKILGEMNEVHKNHPDSYSSDDFSRVYNDLCSALFGEGCKDSK